MISQNCCGCNHSAITLIIIMIITTFISIQNQHLLDEILDTTKAEMKTTTMLAANTTTTTTKTSLTATVEGTIGGTTRINTSSDVIGNSNVNNNDDDYNYYYNYDEKHEDELNNHDNDKDNDEDDFVSTNTTVAAATTTTKTARTIDYSNLTDLYPPLYETNLVPPAINHTFDHSSESSTAATTSSIPTIDIMSTGSESRKDYLHAQLSTWASHKSIRNYWGYTEINDIHTNCSLVLQEKSKNFLKDPYQITNKHFNKCREDGYSNSNKNNTKTRIPKLRKYLKQVYGWGQRKKGIGWLCAQVRFGQSLGKVIKYYRQQIQIALLKEKEEERIIGNNRNQTTKTTVVPNTTVPKQVVVRHYQHILQHPNPIIRNIIPDYLLLVDDDTYINMELFIKHMNSMIKQQGMKKEHNDDSSTSNTNSPSFFFSG